MTATSTEQFIHLVQDSLSTWQSQGFSRPKLTEDLERFRRERLLPILERERKSLQTPYVVSLVGLTNVGKSTLMEALLGFPVAPRKMGPATAVPVEYVHGQDWRILVYFTAAERDSEVLEFPDAKSLGAALRERVVEVPSDTAQGMAWVTVSGPMKILTSGLKLADTPGFGAAQINDESGIQFERLQEFLKSRVHRVYFCVASAGTWAISDCERDFYRGIANLCGHVVVTKWEGSSADRFAYEQKYRDLFPSAKFVFVNAKREMKDSENGVELKNLRKIIRKNESRENRQEMIDQEILAAWTHINDYVTKMHQIEEIPWRKDSLAQFLESCRNRPVLKPLVNPASGEAPIAVQL